MSFTDNLNIIGMYLYLTGLFKASIVKAYAHLLIQSTLHYYTGRNNTVTQTYNKVWQIKSLTSDVITLTFYIIQEIGKTNQSFGDRRHFPK